jgi:hypothetical protein
MDLSLRVIQARRIVTGAGSIFTVRPTLTTLVHRTTNEFDEKPL